MSYLIKRASVPVNLKDAPDAGAWKEAVPLKLGVVLEESTEHRPETVARMLYDNNAIYIMFTVDDRYVKAVAKRDQASVCRDSCVEFFVRPAGFPRYFNFEMSGNGRILLFNITHLRSGKYTKIPLRDMTRIKRFHTLPDFVKEEITEPLTWRLAVSIPIDFFVKYAKVNPDLKGQKWAANFTKCADKTSHPHWLSWRELPVCDYHTPEAFGEIVFE